VKPPARPQFNHPGPPHRHTTQLKPATASPGQNQSASPGYRVQPPVPLAGRSQQIRATLNGTRQVAGSVDIRATAPGKGFIANLKVDQQHRRRGVAAQLIDAAVATARRQGLSSLSLEARPSDNGISPQQLVAMYRRQGFKSVGRSHRGNPLMERKL
jgi:ribosomal protein S18 acetylase RimI-like enzyme